MATFSLDAAIEPTYVTRIDIAAGYAIFSTPVDGILPGDLIQALTFVVTPSAGGAAIISKVIDILPRTDGYFEYVTQFSIDGHFTLTAADIAAMASGSWVYSCSLTLYRNAALITREYQGGAIAVRPTVPVPPLIVNSVVVTGGPFTGAPVATHQLTATTYDGYGNVITGFPVAWTTTNPAIAIVDANGLVTLVTPGTATITATCQGVSSSTTITVTAIWTPTDGDVLFWNNGASAWQPHQPTAARILPGTFGGATAYHFAHGLTIDAGGLAVTAGGVSLGLIGSGVNVASGDVIISGPVSTGSATPGTIRFQAGHVGISGSTAQTLEDVMLITDRNVTFTHGLSLTGGVNETGLLPSHIYSTSHVGIVLTPGVAMYADFLLENSVDPLNPGTNPYVPAIPGTYVMAVETGSIDVGFVGKIYALGKVYGSLGFNVGGQQASVFNPSPPAGFDGINFSGPITNITVIGGIVTAAS